MKQTYSLLFIAAISAVSIFTSCQKAVNFPQTYSAPEVQISASIHGSVIDENQSPVPGAVVTAEALSAITDESGRFVINDVQLYQNAGSVKVEKDGYLIGSGSYVVNGGVSEKLEIRLVKNSDGSNASGGSLAHKAND